jgi:hypothetical protein
MTETKHQPKFVLVCWPLWCLAEPERSQRTKFYVGLQQADGNTTILWGPTKDQAEAEGLVADPQRVKLLLAYEHGSEVIDVMLAARSTVVAEAIGKPLPRFVFTNYEDWGYGQFLLDARTPGSTSTGSP